MLEDVRNARRSARKKEFFLRETDQGNGERVGVFKITLVEGRASFESKCSL